MKIKVNRITKPYVLQAQNEEGQSIIMDASPNIGGANQGFRPMQLVASALAGCASIDVLLILKKQKLEPEIFEVEVDGSRVEEHPQVFQSIHLIFKFKGVPKEKAERAVDLSVQKYCSVVRMLEATVKITSSIELIK